MCGFINSKMLACVFAGTLLGVPLQMTAQQQKVSLKLNQASLPFSFNLAVNALA